jgi:hypothetical protein
MKLDLLPNAGGMIKDDAIRFVKQSKEKLKSSQSEEDNKESKEPDYDEQDSDKE